MRKLQEKVDNITNQILTEEITDGKKTIISEMKKIGIESLPYAYTAMKTFIDSETMNVHYNKHYKGYVEKLNKALSKKDYGDLELEEIVKSISRFNKTIRDNAGGAFNHALFWKMLSPKPQKPTKDSFFDTKNGSATSHYYSVLFHELTHWTGDKTRMNRDLSGFFGNPSYAFEELIAELGSAYQCNKLNIDNEPRVDHAQYLNNWIKAIEDNDKVLLKASSMANKAVGYMDILQENKAKIAA